MHKLPSLRRQVVAPANNAVAQQPGPASGYHCGTAAAGEPRCAAQRHGYFQRCMRLPLPPYHHYHHHHHHYPTRPFPHPSPLHRRRVLRTCKGRACALRGALLTAPSKVFLWRGVRVAPAWLRGVGVPGLCSALHPHPPGHQPPQRRGVPVALGHSPLPRPRGDREPPRRRAVLGHCRHHRRHHCRCHCRHWSRPQPRRQPG
jgi:hypothetical protein